MTLAEYFNDSAGNISPSTDGTRLTVSHYDRYTTFDFALRLMFYNRRDSDVVVPFSQLDPEVLAAAHARLVRSCGDKVPDLPAPPAPDAPTFTFKK